MNKSFVAVVALSLGLLIGYGVAPMLRGEVASNDPAPEVPEAHTIHDAMGDMTGNLVGKEGAAFDEAFIDDMIVHHEGAVAMAQMVLQKSTRPELTQLATEIIGAQTKEIEMMRQWKAEWFGAGERVVPEE